MSNKIKSINSVDELKMALEISDGYMVSVTVLENDELRTFLLTKDFPKLDMLPSLRGTKNLIVENLEETKHQRRMRPKVMPGRPVEAPPVEEAEFKEEKPVNETEVSDAENTE